MTISLIRSADLVASPWKNGGGTTSEVCVTPPGAGLDDFDWRLSMADVASEGPFSSFRGIDRTLVLVDGWAIVLASAGEVVRLDPESPIARFSGDAVTDATLPAGPIRDLNIMTRRARFGHRLWITDEGVAQPQGTVSTALVVALRDGVVVVGDATVWQLNRFDTLRINDPATLHRVGGLAILIEISPQSAGAEPISSRASGGPVSGSAPWPSLQ